MGTLLGPEPIETFNKSGSVFVLSENGESMLSFSFQLCFAENRIRLIRFYSDREKHLKPICDTKGKCSKAQPKESVLSFVFSTLPCVTGLVLTEGCYFLFPAASSLPLTLEEFSRHLWLAKTSSSLSQFIFYTFTIPQDNLWPTSHGTN